jgi:RNA polymerase sigma-70 factor (family 1)
MATTPSISDAQLMAQIRVGESTALDELFRRHYADLCRTANRIVKDESQAEDVVQELFFSLWNKKEGLPQNLTAVGGYLHRSARNRSLNYLRDQKRIPIDDGEIPENIPTDSLPSDGLTQDDLRQRINGAIDQLPERCRLVFIMSKLEDMSQREIADSLDISTKTVENQMTRAYRFLRQWLAMFLLMSDGFW